MHSFFFQKHQLISFTFNLRVLHVLKFKVHVSKCVCRFFQFQWQFIFFVSLYSGFITLEKSRKFYVFSFFLEVWKRLETSGFGTIFNFLFWNSLENAFDLKLKIFILKLFLQLLHVVLLTV